MKYHYRIRRVNWKDPEEKDRWFGDALMYGPNFDYIVTENNGVEEISFYIGDHLFDKSITHLSERDLRVIDWIKENHPELLI